MGSDMSPNNKSLPLRVHAALFPLLYSGFISFAMILSLLISLWLHFSQVTKNHCRVWEFWPSVSASIGDYSPEKNIWRIGLALGSGPKFIQTIVSYRLLDRAIPDRKAYIVMEFAIDILRIFAAGGWTYISSSEYLLIHEICFVCYVLFSFIYCGMHLSTHHQAYIQNSNQEGQKLERLKRSYFWKRIFVWVQFLCFAAMLYYFYEHRMYCTTAAYSKYALLEWILSMCNILYDATYYWDFQGHYFTLSNDEKDK